MVIVRRRRPLLRAAAIGGGAYALGKRRAQAGGSAAEGPAEPQEPASPAQGGPSASDVKRLGELADLHRQGVLSDQELAEQKARILG